MAPKPADNLVCIGVSVRAHGIRGEVRLALLSEESGRLKKGMRLQWRRSGYPNQALTISAVRERSEKLFLHFAEIPDRNAAETLNGGKLWGEAEADPELDEDTYFHHQLLGLTVVDEAGTELGELVAVFEMGAHDNYEVQDPNGVTFLVPAVAEFILGVDLSAGQLVINAAQGLLPEVVEVKKPSRRRRRRSGRAGE